MLARRRSYYTHTTLRTTEEAIWQKKVIDCDTGKRSVYMASPSYHGSKDSHLLSNTDVRPCVHEYGQVQGCLGIWQGWRPSWSHWFLMKPEVSPDLVVIIILHKIEGSCAITRAEISTSWPLFRIDSCTSMFPKFSVSGWMTRNSIYSAFFSLTKSKRMVVWVSIPLITHFCHSR